MNRYSRTVLASLLATSLLITLCGAVIAQSELATRMDLFQSSSSYLEARWQRLSTAQKAVAYLKRITPFYSWITLCAAVDVEDKSFLMGECLQQEADAVFSIPVTRLEADYSRLLDQLWARSELDALTFASAVVGEASTVRQLRDIISIVQLLAIGFVAAFVVKRTVLTKWLLNIRWELIRHVFYVCAVIWLLGGALLQVAAIGAGSSTALLNLQTIVLLVFGGLSLILGALLFGRWLYTKNL